jgi:quercetin dioxygenase-like cupin family protein
MTEDVVEDPVLRQRYVFRRSAGTLEVAIWVDPGGGVVPHVHPDFEERFEVVSGEMMFLVGRTWVRAGAGEVVVVAPGTRHSYANRSSQPAHMRCQAQPPRAELQGFLEDAAALARAGGYTHHALPRTLAGLIGLAVIARGYRDSTVILRPPVWLQRLLVDPLARLGARRGLRPGHFAESLGGGPP